MIKSNIKILFFLTIFFFKQEDNKNNCSCTILQTGGGQAETDRHTVLKWLVSYQYEWKRWINVSVSEDILTCL